MAKPADGIPAIFKNAVEAYKYLHSISTEVEPAELLEYGFPIESEGLVRIYTGHSTKDLRNIGLSPSAIQHAMGLLKAMNCITLLLGGSKIRPSIYILNFLPEPSHYHEFKGNEWMLERKINPTNYEYAIGEIRRLNDQYVELMRRIEILEGLVANGRHDL